MRRYLFGNPRDASAFWHWHGRFSPAEHAPDYSLLAREDRIPARAGNARLTFQTAMSVSESWWRRGRRMIPELPRRSRPRRAGGTPRDAIEKQTAPRAALFPNTRGIPEPTLAYGSDLLRPLRRSIVTSRGREFGRQISSDCPTAAAIPKWCRTVTIRSRTTRAGRLAGIPSLLSNVECELAFVSTTEASLTPS